MARMRLRRRPAPRRTALGEGWLLPRRSGRWTTIGSLDSPERAAVDPAGCVTLAGRTWSLDWWIGAEDRWHLPCREVAVRQSLVGGSPVVETRLRVPSGDAVHRAYGARARDGREAIVVEVENASKVPFAVALAIRPFVQVAGDQPDDGWVASVALDGRHLAVDGQTVLVLPRSPGRVALGDADGGDITDVVLGGGAEPVGPAEVTCPQGLAHAALLFPLAHTAVLRVVLPLGAAGGPLDPADVPGPQDVASGWAAQAGGGARFEPPDRRLRDAVLASTRHLLLAERTPAVAMGLDAAGFADEAARALTADPLEMARTSAPGAALDALGGHWALTRDEGVAVAVAEVVPALVAALRRSTTADAEQGRQAVPSVAALLHAVGEARAADDLRRLGPATATDDAAAPATDRLTALLADATGTWTWPGRGAGHDPAANAEMVLAVRDLFVHDAARGLDLSPTVPPSWLGQGWEAHDVPTRHGRLSFAVRWHGDRPALLWELVPHDPAPVRLAAPGLDPAWSTTDRAGEALLAPVDLPEAGPRRGITMPVTIEPIVRRSS